MDRHLVLEMVVDIVDGDCTDLEGYTAGCNCYRREENSDAGIDLKAIEVLHSLEVVHCHNSRHSLHVTKPILPRVGIGNSRLGMVDWTAGSLALDNKAELGCSRRMLVLVEVVLLIGVACWRADLVDNCEILMRLAKRYY